jgi:hypothetical protein
MIKTIERKDERKLIVQNLTLYLNRANGHLCSVYGFQDTKDGKYVSYIDFHEDDLLKRIKARPYDEWFENLKDGQPRCVLFELPNSDSNKIMLDGLAKLGYNGVNNNGVNEHILQTVG